jgi:hypothetical protein
MDRQHPTRIFGSFRLPGNVETFPISVICRESILIRILFFIISVMIFIGCGDPRQTGTPVSTIYLYQYGQESVIPADSDVVRVQRANFSLRFYNHRYDPANNLFYAARVAVFRSPEIPDRIIAGINAEDTPCFAGGTGMAPGTGNRYDVLFFNDYGHHYLYYDSGSNRLNLVGDDGAYIKLEFPVTGLFFDGNEYRMDNPGIDRFYLVLYVDRDLDGIIGPDELRKLEIQFE